VRPLLWFAAIFNVFIPRGAFARGFTPYCGSSCRYEEQGFVVWIIGSIALAVALIAVLFYGADVVSILRGNSKKDSSLGDCAFKFVASILVAAFSILVTGGGALVGLLLIVLYCCFGGRRRRW
jgi:hypothetical protein